VIGYEIIDLNHDSRIYIKNNIRQFDSRMNVVWQSGGRLVQISTSFVDQFTRMMVDMDSVITMDPPANQIISAMADAGAGVIHFRDQFCLVLSSFVSKKVTYSLSPNQ